MRKVVALTATLLVVTLSLSVLPAFGWGLHHGRGEWEHHRWHRHPAYGFAGSVVVYEGYPYLVRGDRGFWGSVLGGVTGGLLGSTIGGGAGRAAAIIGGTVVGALVGSSVGRTMDALDRQYLARSLEYDRSHVVTTWRNPDTGTRYQAEPLRTYQRADGRYCREYQTRALIGAEWQQVYGTACRQPDGSWQLVQ